MGKTAKRKGATVTGQARDTGTRVFAIVITIVCGAFVFKGFTEAAWEGLLWKQTSDMAQVAPDFEQRDPHKAQKVPDFALKDRFGKVPNQTIELMNVVRLRWHAIDLGIEKLILKNKKMIAYFISNQESPYYQSALFSKILGFIQQNPKGIKMKELNKKLTLSFENISSVKNAIEKVQRILE